MKSAIAVITDTSGSFAEYGKSRITRNTCRLLDQALALADPGTPLAAVSLIFHAWGSAVTPLEKDQNQDIPAFKSAGSASLPALCGFLQRWSSSRRGLLPVIILTDGLYDCSSKELSEEFLTTLDLCRRIVPVFIAVGQDADEEILRRLSPYVFTPDNALAALDLAAAIPWGGNAKKCADLIMDDLAVLDMGRESRKQPDSRLGSGHGCEPQYAYEGRTGTGDGIVSRSATGRSTQPGPGSGPGDGSVPLSTPEPNAGSGSGSGAEAGDSMEPPASWGQLLGFIRKHLAKIGGQNGSK